MTSAPQLQNLYFKLEEAEVMAREFKEFDLAREMDNVLKKIHVRYLAARGPWKFE